MRLLSVELVAVGVCLAALANLPDPTAVMVFVAALGTGLGAGLGGGLGAGIAAYRAKLIKAEALAKREAEEILKGSLSAEIAENRGRIEDLMATVAQLRGDLAVEKGISRDLQDKLIGFSLDLLEKAGYVTRKVEDGKAP